QGLILASTAALFLPVDAMGVASSWSAKESEEIIAFATREWGTVGFAEFANPDAARDPAFASWFARSNRLAYNPRHAGTAFAEAALTGVRVVLSGVRVRPLVLPREDFQGMAFENGRSWPEHTPGPHLVAMAGRDAYVFTAPAGTTHIEK